MDTINYVNNYAIITDKKLKYTLDMLAYVIPLGIHINVRNVFEVASLKHGFRTIEEAIYYIRRYPVGRSEEHTSELQSLVA
jgi:hypothetical protein